MSWPVTLDATRLDLRVGDRIPPEDSARQMRSASEVLRRLGEQPGVILADEVGMGKTFVALAVAIAAMWADRGRRPVVVMVPSAVQAKWTRDLEHFRERYLLRPEDRKFRIAEAGDALAFFRLLDDPKSRRASVIFLSHGSFHRNLQDPWVKLAILKFAIHHAKLGHAKRRAIYRFAPDILRTKSTHEGGDLFERLLTSDFATWKDLLQLDDDPVPAALEKALHRGDVDVLPLRDALREMPERESPYLEERLKKVRQTLNASFQTIWQVALRAAAFRSPLLILDEAHHVRNPKTKLASLFVSDEAVEDARMLAGALEGGFERMVFLTATPFQLGHAELLHVLERFQGIDWTSLPASNCEAFLGRRDALGLALDDAQKAAVALDHQWGKHLRPDDVEGELEAWWTRLRGAPASAPERLQDLVRAVDRTERALRAAEAQLQPWVLRNRRAIHLPNTTDVERRVRYPGRAIQTGLVDERLGLGIEGDALLPFLLAARAQAIVAHVARQRGDIRVYRATFADGLASSYETFLETSRDREDVADDGVVPSDIRLDQYLSRLRDSLPDEATYASHPKIAATVARVVRLWQRGEKVVVFCHYRHTGRSLEKHIASALEAQTWRTSTARLGIPETELRALVEHWDSGFAKDRPLDRTLSQLVQEELLAAGALPEAEVGALVDVARRFLRTSSFLLRFLDLGAEDRPAALERALRADGGTGASLGARLRAFATFLVGRCTPSERARYVEALSGLQPDAVRRATGEIERDTRERLLLCFNTPFFPEVLVASSVMAEGVDLHLNCRHMIHHDLDWNPSMLEQRTGRIDRLGAKAEQVSRSIEVYLPYIAGTQDEKMYRVVMDRERWFQIMMGDDYRTDEHSTDVLAARVPLPESLASALALRLEG